MNKGKLMNFHQWPCQNSFNPGFIGITPIVILRVIAIVIFLFFTASFSASALALMQAQQESETVQYELTISEAELAQTLAPIALYPDTLLTHILIAATYPIEVIEAQRWLSNNTRLTTTQLQKKSEKKKWDASVKALLPFPRVMKQLNEELSWMKTLGDAFLQDETRVLASIQRLRQQAEQAGSLANITNVDVIKEQQVIIIEPAQANVIYVPYYDTRVVYGRWHWSQYPPVYWRQPTRYAAHYGHFYWGHGVHIRNHFFFSAFHWHNRHVVVRHSNRHSYYSRKKIVNSHHAKRWNHQVKHRRAVAHSSGRISQKYYGAKSNGSYNNRVNHNKVKHNKSGYNNKNKRPVKHTKVTKQRARQVSNKRYSTHKVSSSKQTHKYAMSKPATRSAVKHPARQSARQSARPSTKQSRVK